jgi:hypothetical protein
MVATSKVTQAMEEQGITEEDVDRLLQDEH